ncbi:BRO1-like domain-containing protein [Mycena floridula]|nr:BRO1-like domain-containing protein [Mycena floridula]
MAHQSPMMAIPKKGTDEVDWTTPIRSLISKSYGESPDNYATECAALQRCRQDAVRGAGSDITARDLLYKYFGQLELLELRFSEIRVTFPWRDAFTNKLITQTSIAYEKASILFQIAATHSAIATSQSRSDPEGLKRSFHYFRTCAGMLTYINENFLHAPSTDLSREVVKFLVNVILAQATEVFFEKCTDEKKGNALVSKIGAQAASMYSTLVEDVKEFMGKGIFDRNWVTLIQVKAKYFTSLSQYYRGLADNTTGKHGDALVRFTLAETLAKEATRTAASFGSAFVSSVSPTLPSDAGPSIQERTKIHLALVSERKNEAQRENDLIYNAVLPAPEALPIIDKTVVATPIPIQEVYGAPDVQKTIGPDIFIKLVPLSVHESASVYSEEKAKFVRGEVEKAEAAEGEMRSGIDGLGIKEGLARFRAMAEGEIGGDAEIPVDVKRWRDDITVIEDRESVEVILGQLTRLKEGVRSQLQNIPHQLDTESRDCEMMRVKYEHLWSQQPSAALSKSLRQDLKSHFGSLEAAAASDQQVVALWDSIKNDLKLLLSPQLEAIFRNSAEGGHSSEHLLDLDVGNEADDGKERAKIGNFVAEIDERLGRLNKISRERNEVLKDLKEKVQTDDVSHLLLLNRRNTGVEPALFAAELEKFRPYQQRLAATVHLQEAVLKEIQGLWKNLKDAGGRGAGARRWDEREKRKKDTVRRFQRTRDGYMEVRDGVAKGLQFYTELNELTQSFCQNVKNFISSRVQERDSLVAQLEVEKRFSKASSPPPLAAKPPPPLPPGPSGGRDLGSSFANMNLHQSSPAPQWQQSSYQYSNPSNNNQYGSQSPYMQPPVQPIQSPPSDPYSALGGFNPRSQPALPPPPPSQPSAPPSDPYASLGTLPPPPPQIQQQSMYNYSQSNYSPPGPPPAQFQFQQQQPPPPPPPGQQNYQGYQPSQGYGGYSQGY